VGYIRVVGLVPNLDMSLPPGAPPEAHDASGAMTLQNDVSVPHEPAQAESSEKARNGDLLLAEPLSSRETHEDVQVPATQPPPVTNQDQMILTENGGARELRDEDEPEPKISQDVTSFDWQDFQTRYIDAISAANEKEDEIMLHFQRLSEYFAVWAMATSHYDEERALKRLKTREVYIQHAEHKLEEKKKHYLQVVEAFKKALELLGGS